MFKVSDANTITESGIRCRPDYDVTAVAGFEDVLRAPHAYDSETVARALGVDLTFGLTKEEAGRRLARDGANALERTYSRAWWRLLADQFASIVVWLLVAAAFVAWMTDGPLEAYAILVVLFLNAAVGFAIEWQSGRTLSALRRETRATAQVRRDGIEHLVDAAELVTGDLISLAAGDRVPADARIVEAANLRADESALTGESTAVGKNAAKVTADALLADRGAMLYLGTSIIAGRAAGIVTATGASTELGRIGRLIAEADEQQTPLERRLGDLGRRLVYVVLGIAAVMMFVGYLRGDEWWLMLEVSISLAVAAVPEGLPAVTTLILALGVLRMARRHAIVRRLAAVETLGSTTVICTDKTGTLTENQMTVREYRLSNNRVFTLPAKTDDINSLGSESPSDEVLARLVRVSLLCNDASFNTCSAGDRLQSQPQSLGDPTETALLVAASQLGFEVQQERARFSKLLEHPFEAATRRMIILLQDASGLDGHKVAMIKGAPSVVLNACTHFANQDNEAVLLDEQRRASFLSVNEMMAERALRVLAFAEKRFEVKADKKSHRFSEEMTGVFDIENGYTFLGFAGMSDPPRAGVASAISEAGRAGIRVVMLTGDQIRTARAVALELHLAEADDLVVLHARDLAAVDSEQAAELARTTHVFARMSPEDKLRIVEALQQSGEIVAVTGDGINDAPALKRAQIGIAMGARGTEVAKEAADIVLADDNFATIIKAVEGGRAIYANIIKFVHMMFSHNLGEVIFIFAAIIAGLPLPLLPLQILWLNLVTDVFPALALALEPPARETMRRRPRPPDEALLSESFMLLVAWQGMLLAAITLVTYLWALEKYGAGSHARTVALFALVGVQLGHLFNCRSRTRSAFAGFFRNPFIFIAAAIVITLQLLAAYLTPLARVLDVSQPKMIDWLTFSLSVLLPILIVEIAKYFARQRMSDVVS